MNTGTAEQRISVLENEVRALKILLGAQQRTLTPPPRQNELPVRVTSPPLARLVLPTEEEFQRLFTVVTSRYPILKLRADSPDYFPQFKAAFIRLSHCGRRDKVDHQRGLGFWIDDASEWCRRHQIRPSEISGGALTIAVIAHADIKFVMADWPHDTAFALQFGGGGYDAKGWWRRALAGTLLDPVPPLHPLPAASPARVQRQ